MKTSTIALVTLGLVLTSAPTMGQASGTPSMQLEVRQPIAEVISVEGDVQVIRGRSAPQPLDVSSPVYLEDRLTSGPGARAQIMFIDNAILSLGENSEVTVDEYVYNPDEAAANRSVLRVVKGLFRVISARIADLNPDRYEVKSNLATIGIRGCEVGFDLRGEEERIQIIRLPRGRSIHITQRDEIGNGRPGLVIEDQGRLVQMRPGRSPIEGRLPAAELRALWEATTPKAYAGRTDKSRRRTAARARDGNAPSAETDSDTDQLVRTAQEAQAREELAQMLVKTDETIEDGLVPGARSGAGGDPVPAYPIRGARMGLGSGGGQDWSWGTWARDSTYLEGGSEVVRTEYGASATGNRIGQAQFANIHQGSVVRLHGDGVAAAGLSLGKDSRLLEGTSRLNVLAGGGAAPNWLGKFDLSSGQGDRLTFMANGTIDTDGSFQTGAAPGTYNLNAMGSSYDGGSLSRNSVGGSLVGKNDQITGAIGDMQFDHGSDGPKVRGMFGSDLAPK